MLALTPLPWPGISLCQMATWTALSSFRSLLKFFLFRESFLDHPIKSSNPCHSNLASVYFFFLIFITTSVYIHAHLLIVSLFVAFPHPQSSAWYRVDAKYIFAIPIEPPCHTLVTNTLCLFVFNLLLMRRHFDILKKSAWNISKYLKTKNHGA